MNDLAIVGISCKFPGANDYNTYWNNLLSKKSSISVVPADRWDWKAFDGKIFEENKTYSKWGGFIEDIDKFDNRFFNISKNEAERMDPQQRIFMEQVWACIEDSGNSPASISGSKTGVFAGISTADYHSLFIRNKDTVESHTISGLASSLLANRVSYFFNLRGPSLPVDTACSSSLVALHQASEAIKGGYCEAAIVGGINLIISPEEHISFSKAGMLSPTGECRTFDADADGYVRGEGCGVIYIKKLEDAVEAEDHIYCVIKGSSVNHGGKVHNVTSPNPYAQANVITDGMIRADISPDKITYIEAHGTGTPLGDPMEIIGLKKAFSNLSRHFGISFGDKPHCGLGTVKTNIGHLEAAAGIAGIIKTALSLKNRKLPALQNFKKQNPKIKIKNTPFYFVDELKDWEGDLLTAGVSSFGFGGANAFIVLQEYRGEKPREGKNRSEIPFIFPFSGKEESNLRQNLIVQKQFIENELPESALADYAYTLQTGRNHFESRMAFAASGKAELLKQIDLFLENKGDQSEKEYSPALKEWIGGGDIIWGEKGAARKISIPTYQFTPTPIWLEIKKENVDYFDQDNKGRSVVEDVTPEDFEEIWDKVIAGEPFDINAELTELDSLSLIGLSLSIQKKYNITLDWALLTEKYNTPEKIIDYINSNLDRSAGETAEEEKNNAISNDIFEQMTDQLSICKPERWFYPKEKNKLPICFIVTSMRHGSSLTSFILNANPDIYAPQGLYLLPFTNLQERAEVLSKQILFLEEGLINTVEDLWQVDRAGADRIIEEWTEERLPIVEIYRMIQEKCYPRILVDRGTIYGLDINILERARKSFENIKFIHLLRHPASVFRSGTTLLKKTALMKRLITQEDFDNPAVDKKIQTFLDKMWSETHMNFYNFDKTLPREASYTLKFENLVGDSAAEIRKLSDFIGVPFSDLMLNPYDVEENVKLHNKKGESGISSIDPKVMTRTQIESKNSDNWKKFIPLRPISTETKYFMEKYSYDVVEKERDYSEFIETVNEGNGSDPILVIPGFGGKLDAFKRIFSGSDLKVDGLKMPDYIPFDSIGNMAYFYADKVEVLSRYKVIVGYSLGALIAWELTGHLLEGGNAPRKLILIDRNPLYPMEELYVESLEGIKGKLGDKYTGGSYETTVIEGLINYGLLFLNFDEKRTENNILKLMEVKQEKDELIKSFVSTNSGSVMIESELKKFVSLYQLTRKMLEKYKAADWKSDSLEKVYFQPEATEHNPLPKNMKRVIISDCDHFSIINRDRIGDRLLSLTGK